MRENPLATGGPRYMGDYSAPHPHLAAPPQEPHTALGPSGLQPWPFGPQIRLPKSAYVVN